MSSGGGLRRHRIEYASGTHVLPFPQDYRCPFGEGGPTGARLAIAAVEHLFGSPHSGLNDPASIVSEFVLGEGGVVPAVPVWAQALRRAATTAGVPLIADEGQAGMYRTGRAWAFEHCDVEPDMIAISKGLGSGVPIAVLVVRREFDTWSEGAFTGTFRGNALAFAAASAVLRFAATSGLGDHVTEVGAQLHRGLLAVAETTDVIGDVRAVGLLAAAEIVDPTLPADARGVGAPSQAIAEAVQRECLASGLIVELGGQFSNVVRFLPPLIVTDAEVAEIVTRFHDAVARVDAALRSQPPIVAGLQ